MKFAVDCPAFIAVAQVVAKSIQQKDVQGRTILSLDNNILTIKHRSSTSFFKGSVAVSEVDKADDEVTSWGVDSNQFKTILSVIPNQDTKVYFEITSDGRLFNIQVLTSKMKLPIFEATTPIPDEQVQSVGTVQAKEFIENLANLSKITMTDESTQGHAISCVHITIKNHNLALMATNSIALVEKKQTVENDTSITVLVKPHQANLLTAARFDDADVTDLLSSQTMFGVKDKFGTVCLVSRHDVAPLQYAGFSNMVSDEQLVAVSTDSFKYAIDSLGKLSANSNELLFTYSDNTLTVSNSNLDQIKVGIQGTVEDTQMSLVKSAISQLMMFFSKGAVQFCWPIRDGARLVQVKCYKEDNTIDENTFICITTNDRG